MASQMEQALAAALRKSQSDISSLKNGMQELHQLLAKTGAVSRSVNDVPGKRVQYIATIDVVIAANSTSRVEGTYSVSSDGPFIVTGIAMFFQQTAGPYAGPWMPATTVDAHIAGASQQFGFMGIYDKPAFGSFDVEFSEAGVDRIWQNNPFASALFSPSVGGVYVMPIGASLGRSAVLTARVTPTVAQPYAGKVQVILLGYKIVQSDSVQP